MKEILREKIEPIPVSPGDEVALKCDDGIEEKTVLEVEIDREMVLDEAVIFYVEKGNFKDAEDGIGGAFLKGVSGKGK